VVTCVSPIQSAEVPKDGNKVMARLPRVYNRAAEVLLLQKSIAMAADYVTGLCTPQALLRRHSLDCCTNARLRTGRCAATVTRLSKSSVHGGPEGSGIVLPL
jgi:hypothetical protein